MRPSCTSSSTELKQEGETKECSIRNGLSRILKLWKVIMRFTVVKENGCFLVHGDESPQRHLTPRHKIHKRR